MTCLGFGSGCGVSAATICFGQLCGWTCSTDPHAIVAVEICAPILHALPVRSNSFIMHLKKVETGPPWGDPGQPGVLYPLVDLT